MLAKHLTIKSLLEILCDTERAKDKCQKLVEICQGIEKMPCVHQSYTHKKNKASTVQAIFDNFLQRNKTEFLIFVIFYITMY